MAQIIIINLENKLKTQKKYIKEKLVNNINTVLETKNTIKSL